MKNLTELFAVSFLMLLSVNIFSQDILSLREKVDISIPEKVERPVFEQLPSGTYTVGNSGYFPTIDSAFNKLSIDGIAGDVTLELIDDIYSLPGNSSGFLLNGPISGAGPDSRLTIRPALNKNVTIVGDGESVLYFINTSYVTIDGIGLKGNTTLKIAALQNTDFNWNDGIIFLNNSKHNTIKNITFECRDYSRLSGGIVFLHQSGNFTPDSNLIENNFIKEAAVGINISSFFYRATGNIIKGNFIGSETDSLISMGINVTFGQYTIIENNIVQNIRNKGQVVYSPGIASVAGTGDTIRNNVVHNVSVDGGYYGGIGIILNGTTTFKGCINTVYNNMVYDIRSSSAEVSAIVGGIELRNQDFAKIYHNSIYLTETGSNKSGSASLYITNSCSNTILKNNILINTRDESPYNAFALNDCSSANLSSDYNNLYVGENQNNFLVRKNGFDYRNLSSWQSTGMDNHSYNEMPFFVSTDLHISSGLEECFEMNGTPISGITTDIDGDLRDSETPDIGADEFNCVVNEVQEENLPVSFELEQNYPNPFNPITTISWNLPEESIVTLKVFNALGEEVVTLVNNESQNAGKHSALFIVNSLMGSGVYFYRLEAGSLSTSSEQSFVETKKMVLLK